MNIKYPLSVVALCTLLSQSSNVNAELDITTAPSTGKVVICHYPPGNQENVQTISISVNSLNAHLWDHVDKHEHQYDDYADANGTCPSHTIYTPSVATIDTNGIKTATENTKPTITGTVGVLALGDDVFTVTLTKNGSTLVSYTKGDASLTIAPNSKEWTLAIPMSLSAGEYDVVANRAGTIDTSTGELIVGIAYCDKDGITGGYTLRSNFPAIDANGGYLGKCDAAVTKTAPLPYLDTLQPQKLVGTGGVCTDAEGGGTRNIQPISTATIKRATIINATTIGGTTTKKLADTIVRYGERSVGGVMDISKAVITGGIATNVTLSGVTINNLYLDSDGSFDIATGVFTPSDSYIGVIDGTTGITKSSGDGSVIPKARITDGVITSGTTSDTPIRGRILAGFYDTATSSTTTTTTKGRRTVGTLTGATITGATTTTSKMADGTLKTVVESGDITAGTFTITSTFGTATNAKIVNATITNVNSCFASSEVSSRGQLNWKEVISE